MDWLGVVGLQRDGGGSMGSTIAGIWTMGIGIESGGSNEDSECRRSEKENVFSSNVTSRLIYILPVGM